MLKYEIEDKEGIKKLLDSVDLVRFNNGNRFDYFFNNIEEDKYYVHKYDMFKLKWDKLPGIVNCSEINKVIVYIKEESTLDLEDVIFLELKNGSNLMSGRKHYFFMDYLGDKKDEIRELIFNSKNKPIKLKESDKVNSKKELFYFKKKWEELTV